MLINGELGSNSAAPFRYQLVDYRIVDSKSEAEMQAQFAEAQKHIAEPYRSDFYGVPPEHSCFYNEQGIFQARM